MGGGGRSSSALWENLVGEFSVGVLFETLSTVFMLKHWLRSILGGVSRDTCLFRILGGFFFGDFLGALNMDGVSSLYFTIDSF